MIRFDATTGAFVDVFAANALFLFAPRGLQFGSDGKLYVASSTNNLVVRFNFDGTFDEVFASGNGLSAPSGIVFDSAGKLYVSNTGANNVLRFNVDGSFDRIFATGNGLSLPQGLMFGSDGKLYIVNVDGQNVLRFNADGSFDRIFTSGPTKGEMTFRSLVFDSAGRLYVTVGEGMVLRYSSTGAYDQLFAAAGNLLGAWGLLFGPDGYLYVAVSTLNPLAVSGPNSSVLRYNGVVGSYDSVFASGSGLDWPTYILVY